MSNATCECCSTRKKNRPGLVFMNQAAQDEQREGLWGDTETSECKGFIISDIAASAGAQSPPRVGLGSLCI